MRPALKWRHGVALLVIVVVAGVGGSSALAGQTLNVCGTCTYTTIQAAITAASDGDTIQVAAGTYSGSVTVNKSLTIDGAQHGVDARTRSTTDVSGESVVAWTGSGNGAFAVFADNVTIDGFTIRGAGTQANPASGVWTNPAFSGTHGGTHVLDNIIRDNMIGIYLQNGNTLQTVVQHNLFLDNNLTGPSGGTGIYSDSGLSVSLIDGNTFTDNPDTAINLVNLSSVAGSGSSNVVSGNAMDSQIYLYGEHGQVTGNSITDSTGGGIVLGGLDGVATPLTISDNTVDGVASGFAALRMRNDLGGASSNVTFSGNTFAGGAGYGVKIGDGGYSGALNLGGSQISGTQASIENDDATLTIDATLNYWGTAVSSSIAAKIIGVGAGHVTFAPFYADAARTTRSDVVPSSVFVGATYSDGSAGGHSFGYDAFSTISAGVGAVAAGGTVTVAAGTYDVATTLSIAKGVTLLGPNAGVDANAGTSVNTSRVAEAVITSSTPSNPSIRVGSAVTDPVTIDGFDFDGGSSLHLGNPIDAPDSATAYNIVFRNNLVQNVAAGGGLFFVHPATLVLTQNRFTSFTPSGSNTDTVFVNGNSDGTSGTQVTITGNVFADSGDDGMNLSSTRGSVTGNTFSNLPYYGILLANNPSNMTVSGNVFDGLTNPVPGVSSTYGAGIRFFGPTGSGPVAITGNTFSNSNVGIAVRPSNSIAGLNVQIASNIFSNDVAAIRHEGTGAIAAGRNYFGDTPTFAANVDSTGKTVDGTGASLVSVMPWCLDSSCVSLSDADDLLSLSLSSGSLSPAFASSTTAYSASVDNATSSVVVTRTAASGATVVVGGNSSLAVGANTVTLAVTSADGSATKTYTVTVTRAAGTSTTTTATTTTTPAPPVTTTAATTTTAAAPAVNQPQSAPAQPGTAGTVSVTVGPATTAPGGTTVATVPVSVALSWSPTAFTVPVTVTMTPQPVAATAGTGGTTGGGTTTPAPVAGGFSVGDTVVQVSVTNDAGVAVTQFAAPLQIHISSLPTGQVPAYSRDGTTWTTIPRLDGPELPAGQQDGYFVNADGSIDIYTLHATLFGLLLDTQAPGRPTVTARVIAHKLYLLVRAKDNVELASYRVLLNGKLVKRTKHAYVVLAARPGSFQVEAVDAAGNRGKSSVAVVVARRAGTGSLAIAR